MVEDLKIAKISYIVNHMKKVLSDLDRREFLLATVGGIGLLGASTLSIPSQALASLADSSTEQNYVRRNIYCLDSCSKTILSYSRAVKVMRSRPATNPRSWVAQANIHGAFSPPGGMIANVCEHGTLFFFSWHRMYLYFFERIVRQASADPTFALPYWGYSPSGNRTLPVMFRAPADASNPLHVVKRNPSINAGSAMNPSTVDAAAALAQLGFGSFSSSLEYTPHADVHMAVGGGAVGGGGWMASFEMAAQDPIFWLHHANIDRLWGVWLASGGGRVNPTSSTWLNTSFNFYDANGAQVTMTGAQVVNTASQLSYTYGSSSCLDIAWPNEWLSAARLPPPERDARGEIESFRDRPSRPQPLVLTRAETELRLGSLIAQVSLPVDAEMQRELSAFARDPKAGGEIILVLDDIQVSHPPSVYYEIYVNLPPGDQNPDYTGPHFAGNLGFFGPAPDGPHGRMPMSRTIGLVPVYTRLRRLERWSDEAIRLTFVPRAYTEDKLPMETLGERVQAVIGRISVRVQ